MSFSPIQRGKLILVPHLRGLLHYLIDDVFATYLRRTFCCLLVYTPKMAST